jgi:predicted secreted protein
MRESSRVMAVVEAEGEVYTSARDVKVAISGCA